jgi:hypothetical protein
MFGAAGRVGEASLEIAGDGGKPHCLLYSTIMRRVRMVVILAICCPGSLLAQSPIPPRTVEFRFTPTARTQIAVWVEKPDGKFLATVALTQAVSIRGIGNRPGAAQMNSAYRWPYGRREGVLPVWAHRRAKAEGARQFKRVIFQNRASEGDASRTAEDSSSEPYFCLSFTTAANGRDKLDAITCATAGQPQVDKGRYMIPSDLAAGYSEPAEIAGEGIMRPLDLVSLYPPRRDVTPCSNGCPDRPDVASYGKDARDVMPDIDAVTVATPPPEAEYKILFSIPDDWVDGEYVAWAEVSAEADYNATFNDQTYRIPFLPEGKWDIWARQTGFPYRGQPSMVYQVPFRLGGPAVFSTAKPVGYGDVDGFGPTGGDVHPLDGHITDDPKTASGSGADRLLLVSSSGDSRFSVDVRDSEFCASHAAPAAPSDIVANPHPNAKNSHQWGVLHFVVPTSDRLIDHYLVRFSKTVIAAGDETAFTQAPPAVAANSNSEALTIPVDAGAGTGVEVPFGGMEPLTRYWVAIRAVDRCNTAGPFAVTDLTTTRINFTQLSGCFIATAAYGSAMEPEVDSLRRARDELRPRSPVFAVATDLYYRSGPAAAAVIKRSDAARAVVRTLLGPVVELARLVTLAPHLPR